MKWFAENKFLAVFLAIVLLGVGALGFLLMQAHSSYGDISSQYDEKAKELKRLQALEPYPNAANLKSTTAVRDDYKAQIDGLFGQMSALSLPIKSDLTPNAFQDELRAAVSSVTAKAASEGVEIKEPFYLGFEAYQNTLPPAAAAPSLERNLAAIKMLAERLIDLRAVSINSIKRTQIPEESGTSTTPKPAGQAPGKTGGDKALEITVRKDLVEFAFVVKPAAFKQIMNDLATSKQYLVVRTLVARNTSPTSPSRDLAQFTFNATGEPAAEASADGTVAPRSSTPNPAGGAADGGAADGSEGGRKKLIFGAENVEVEMLIELLNFTSNSQPAEGASPAATN